jgi:hypothetical protein
MIARQVKSQRGSQRSQSFTSAKGQSLYEKHTADADHDTLHKYGSLLCSRVHRL